MGEYTVATTDQLPPGEVMGVEVDGLEVAVFNVDGEYFAMQNRCIHRRGPLNKIGATRINEEDIPIPGPGGIDAEHCTVSCPWHGWEFDLRTGKAVAFDDRMRTFDVTVVDDEIKVSV